jgi:hypothetical protein
MGTEWACLQDDYYYNSKQRTNAMASRTHILQSGASRYSRSGTTWTSDIIVVLWDQWYKVWTIRNAYIHGHDKETRDKRQCEIDEHRLRSIYKNRHQMEPSVQDLLFESVETHQSECGPLAIRNWLSIHKTTFLQSLISEHSYSTLNRY